MTITPQEQRIHFTLLSTIAPKLSKKTRVKQSVDKQSLSYAFHLDPVYGKAGQMKPALANKNAERFDIPVYIEFLESWRIKSDGSRRNGLLEFSELSIRLLDDLDQEYLALHWKSKRPSQEPYQPHWHVNAGRSRIQWKAVHFPLNNDWQHYLPMNITEYHAWLENLTKFLLKEFSLALR